MEKTYWLKREADAREMARNALSSEARLIHYDLAGRYGLNAAAASSQLNDLAIGAICAAAVNGTDNA